MNFVHFFISPINNIDLWIDFLNLYFFIRKHTKLFYVRIRKNRSRVATWPRWKGRIKDTRLPMKSLWRYKATHLDLMKRFRVASPLVIIPYFFFSGYANEISQSSSKKWLITYAWNLFIVVGKRQWISFLNLFNQFLFLSKLIPNSFTKTFTETKSFLFIIQNFERNPSQILPSSEPKRRRRFAKRNHPSNFTLKIFSFQKIRATFDFFSSKRKPLKILSENLEGKERFQLESSRKSGKRRMGGGECKKALPPSFFLSLQGSPRKARWGWSDKKAPAGVIMITAVQRKTEYCGARMAAVGSWEIGILERHFRVSASSCSADHQQSCFPIVGPLAFRHPSTNLETRLPILIEYLPTLLSFFPFAIFLSSPFRGSSREFLKRDAEKIISKYFVTNARET